MNRSKLTYRLKFYAFGFIIGLFLLGVIFKGKKCSSPNELKIQELYMQYIVFDDKVKCVQGCLKLDEKKLKEELKKCRVNYDMSDVHAVPFSKYFVEGRNRKDLPYTLVIEDRGDTSKVIALTADPKPAGCDCK